MKNIDERVKRKIEVMKEKVERGGSACLHTVNWFQLKGEINKNHLKLVVSAFL